MSDALISVEMAKNRRIWCFKYVVAYTYAGSQIRTESERCNNAMLRTVSREAVEFFGTGLPVKILSPISQPRSTDYPPIRITAEFASSPMREEMHLSGLIVVWFQNEQFPIPDAAGRAAISSLDWEQLSHEYEI